MPRYLTITPKYNPITLQEYLTVPQMLYEESEQRQKEFDTLEDSVSAYETYARQYPNSEASKQFLNYLDKFNQTADSFYKNPLASNVRSDMLNLRRDFKRVTTPFKQAVATYNTIAQQRAKDTNKGIIGKNIDLDYLLSHPEYTAEIDRGSYVLGNDIQTESKNLFKGLTGFDNTPRQYNNGTQIITEYPQGYSSEEIQTLFADEDNPNLSQELKDTWQMIKNKYGYDSLTPDQQELFRYYALQGALSGTKASRYTTKNTPKVSSKKGESEDNSQRGETTNTDQEL